MIRATSKVRYDAEDQVGGTEENVGDVEGRIGERDEDEVRIWSGRR